MEGFFMEAVAREQIADRARRAADARLARAVRRRRARRWPRARVLAGAFAFWRFES